MTLKIPNMEYDKKINKKDGEKLLNFTEHYIKSFKDDIAEQTYDKATSTRFLGYGAYKILERRRENFSDDEVEDPDFFYIQKYKSIISKLVISTEASNFSNPHKLDLSKLTNLLDFFEHQGYLTKKQIGLVHFLLKNYPSIIFQSTSPKTLNEINTFLHHHIKKDFMKAETTVELAEILTDIKTKQIIPKKKMFFSLSQIRNELSN